MFDPKHPRGAYQPPFKPQHVLITENGGERTSNVTTERIYKAVYEIDANEYVTLEKCRPITLDNGASVFAMTYRKDSRVALFFKVGMSMLRMSRSGYNCDTVADMMCDFFESSTVPDMEDWTCEELMPAPQKSRSDLIVDGYEFRHFDFADVMAALENIAEGRSQWLQHGFTDDNGGYFHILRCDGTPDHPTYRVEWVKWTHPEPTGYRAEISDIEPLRQWLWDFSLNRKYPSSGPEWNEFNVNEYFQQLIQKVLKDTDKPNDTDNDER